MTPPATFLSTPYFFSSPLRPDLVLRVGFAGKRELAAASKRPVPAIAKFYSHKRPTLRHTHCLCEGADSIAFEVQNSSNQNSTIGKSSIVNYRFNYDPNFLTDCDPQLAIIDTIRRTEEILIDEIIDWHASQLSSSGG